MTVHYEKDIENIKSILDEKTTDMSVLIGAGFSKNASKKFPSWGELLKRIVLITHCDEIKKWKISNKNDKLSTFIKNKIRECGYLGVVDDYIKFKGFRESIDYYIDNYFHSKGLCNSNNFTDDDLLIHQKLLDIDWNNIYTTNYDNLFEYVLKRDKRLDGAYKVVSESTDLSSRSKKRIIKLHGDLKNIRLESKDYVFDNDHHSHFIISKEDYENYPKRHDTFATLMKISLLQEHFCLIGFSGNDPNFLDWGDWVRNILKNKKDEIKRHKIYLIDVIDDKIEKDRELFFDNYGIKYIPLKKIYGVRPPNELIEIFLDKISKKQKEIKLDVIEIKEIGDGDSKISIREEKTTIKERISFDIKQNHDYYNLWEKLLSLQVETVNFQDVISDLIKNETNYPLPTQKIIFYSEQTRPSLCSYLNDSKNNLDSENKLKYYFYLVFLLRQCYTSFDSFNEEYIKVYEYLRGINIKELKTNEEICYWSELFTSLLESCRKAQDSIRFEKLYDLISIHNDVLEKKYIHEAKYQKAIFMASHLNFQEAETIVNGWEIEEKSEYSWYFVKKAYLYCLLNTKVSKEKVIPLMQIALKICTNNQIKTFILELILYYEQSNSFNIDKDYKFELGVLKSKGNYTLDDLAKSFFNYEIKKNVKPVGSDRNTLSFKLFNSDYNKQYDYSLKLNEFLTKAGLPPVINLKYGVTYINQTDWFDFNKLLYRYSPEILLFQSLQYGQNDSDQKFTDSILQLIVNSSEIDIGRKIEIFKNFANLWDYYYSQDEFDQLSVVTSAISMLVEIIDYDKWKEFWLKLWKLQKEDSRVENLFYKKHWNWEKQICRMLPYVDNKKECLIRFLDSSINDDSSVIYSYVSSLMFYGDTKEIKVEASKRIKYLIDDKSINYYNLLIIHSIRDLINKSAKDKIKKVVLLQGFDGLENLFSFIFELFGKDEQINLMIHKHIIENKENLIFNSGISTSSRGYAFSLNLNSLYENITFTRKEINEIYIILIKSLLKMKDFRKKNITNTFDYPDSNLLIQMKEFLRKYQSLLQDNSNYKKTIIDVEECFKELIGNLDGDEVLLYKEPNSIQYLLDKMYIGFKEYRKEDIEIFWSLLLNKILKMEEPKFEYCFEFMNWILSVTDEKISWLRNYNNLYIFILQTFYNRIERHELDLEDKKFIIIQNIKLASILNTKYKMKTKIIQKWLDYKKVSEFMSVRNMKLKV